MNRPRLTDERVQELFAIHSSGGSLLSYLPDKVRIMSEDIQSALNELLQWRMVAADASRNRSE